MDRRPVRLRAVLEKEAGVSHKDLEFHVSAGESKARVHRTWKEAAADAVQMSASRGGEMAVIDVTTWSRAAAKAWTGDTEMYDEDPDASVFERFEVRARSVGRIA